MGKKHNEYKSYNIRKKGQEKKKARQKGRNRFAKKAYAHAQKTSKLTLSNPQENKYALSVSFISIVMLIGQKPTPKWIWLKKMPFSVLAGGRLRVKLFM